MQKLCPCVDIYIDRQNIDLQRGWRITAKPNGTYNTEASFCECYKKYQGGCTLLYDMLMHENYARIAIASGRKQTDHWEKRPGTLGLVLWRGKDSTNTNYAGANKKELILAHELTHLWVQFSDNGPHPFEPTIVDKNIVGNKQHEVDHIKSGKYIISGSEIYTVRAANQIGREIYGDKFQPRTTYSKGKIPNYDTPLFRRDCDCKRQFLELEETWGD